jgi:DNA-binding MltR family transcriptional regulator
MKKITTNDINIYNKIKKYSENDEKTILFIDDMTADLKKTKSIIDTFKRLVYNRRHLKLNIIITAQSFVNLPLDIRKNIQR